MPDLSYKLVGEQAMLRFGSLLGKACLNGGVVFLEGDLGAGKTTLSRGVLEGLGYKGHVKSPTYTLVEPYELKTLTVYHFDLYRLGDAEELEYMGIRDYFESNNLCLVEWANRALTQLPSADLLVRIDCLIDSRVVNLIAQTDVGKAIISRIQK